MSDKWVTMSAWCPPLDQGEHLVKQNVDCMLPQDHTRRSRDALHFIHVLRGDAIHGMLCIIPGCWRPMSHKRVYYSEARLQVDWLCLVHATGFFSMGESPFSSISCQNVTGLLYAQLWFNLRPETTYKIGLHIRPLIRLDEEKGSIVWMDSRITPQMEPLVILQVLSFYDDTCTRAKQAISVLWQVRNLHKDIRLVIARGLWHDRIAWA
jgi:hypothetical protein